MVKEELFEEMKDFYEEYREIKISNRVNNNITNNSFIHNTLILRFKDKFNKSLEVNTEFSKHVKSNNLNLLDLEIETIANLSQAKGVDDKEIFENIAFFNFKEYDFDLFQKYFINSNLVKNKIIDYSLEITSKKIIKKKIEYLLSLKVNKKINYFDLNEVRNDLSYFGYLKNALDDAELNQNDKKALKILEKKTNELIIDHLNKFRNNFNFIVKLYLNEFEAILLLDLYFKNQFETRGGGRFILSEDLLLKNIFPIKYFKSLEKKLLDLNLIKKENIYGNDEILLTKRLISLIEDKEYKKEDEDKDKILLVKESFLNPISCNIKFDDVYIDEGKKDILRRTLSQIKNYDLIFNQWGINDSISYGKGLIINFYGPPGTGKTMLAKSIGNYLKKKIIEVDFANLQSMYVGEGDKNISKAFKIAKEEDAVLFFDEADSLIQNRSRSKNSWQRSQTNVLLKEIENFDGVCIFATNFIENYDPAIERRISLNLEFDLPDEKLRSKIFKNHFPIKEALADDVDFDIISKEFNLSGGEIKNAVMHAVRLAASDEKNKEMKIYMKHIKYGCELIEVSKFNSKKIEGNTFNSSMYM